MSSPTISETSDDVNTEKTPHVSTFHENNLNGMDVEAGSDDDEFSGGIEIPKNITPVNEVEEFFRVHLSDVNASKNRRHLGINALFDLICGQACNAITKECQQDRLLSLYEVISFDILLVIKISMVHRKACVC